MAEKKNWIEIFLLPLVIACVGVLGTFLVTQQQEANSNAKADSDRQVKILEIFAEKITNPDEQQRLLAIKLLRVLDDDLAGKLASAVAEAEPEKSHIREVATREQNSRFSVLLFNRPAQEETAQAIKNSLLEAGFQSSATKTELTEASRQLATNEAWVIYTDRGQSILPKVKQILSGSGTDIRFVYEPNPSSLRRGDVQILLF